MPQSDFLIHRDLHELQPFTMPAVELTYEQDKEFQICLAHLLIHAPFFADLTMQQLPMIPTLHCPIAATDGLNIYFNPAPFFKYHTENQAFAVGHEVMHYVYNDVNLMHIWRETRRVRTGTITLPYINFLMGIAADYSINALLIEGSIGTFHKDWLYNESLSKAGRESQVEIYVKLFKALPPNIQRFAKACMDAKQAGQKLPGQDEAEDAKKDIRNSIGVDENGPQGTPTQFDQHLKPGQGKGEAPPEEVVKKRNENEVKVAVAAAAATAKHQGKLPDVLQRFVNEVLNPKVPWYEEIKTLSMRRAGADGLDWTQLDEHMLCRPEPYGVIAWPAETTYGCGVMALGGDTSGSIDQHQLDVIFAEMAGVVAQVNPRELHIFWCDAGVGRHDYLEEPEDLEAYKLLVKKEGVFGGGGTDFRPVFDKIDKDGIEPDVLIYFTDLEGTFPSRAPRYSVVWGALTDHTPPFGDVVRVKL